MTVADDKRRVKEAQLEAAAPNADHVLRPGCERFERIVAYLERTVMSPVALVGQAPGASHDGWIFEVGESQPGKVLVRLEPEEGPFLRYDGAREAALLGELAVRGFAVPRVLGVADRDVCGARFLVLEWIDGDVLNPRAAADMDVARRRALATEMAETLAQLHGVDGSQLRGPGGPMDESDPGIMAMFREFDRALAQLRLVDTVVLDYVRLWLEKHARSRTAEQCLVHGDFRLGNLVWRDDRIAGILDWETARIGDPLFDIAWMCMGATQGSHSIMGLVTRDEFIGLYAQTSGRTVDPKDLVFWQVVAAWVRGCTEARLLDISIMSHAPSARDARDLSWEFGSIRTDEELLLLIDAYEGRG